MSPDPLTPNQLPPKGNPYALIGMGFEFACSVAVLAFGGWWLDERFASSPWLLLTGLALGFAGGFYRLWRKAMSKDD